MVRLRSAPRYSLHRNVRLIGTLLGLFILGCDGGASSPNTTSHNGSAPDTLADHQSGGLLGSHASAAATQESEDIPRIVAFGNSLTAGFGVGSQDTYPAQLQARLNTLGYRFRVINAGVSGETTAGGVRRVSWVMKSQPRLVILELGGNDGLRGLNLEQTRANLEGMIRTLKEAGIIVVLAGMKIPPNYGIDYTERFESMYRDLAHRHKLPLIPFFLAGVGGMTSLNQSDGIHPTREGYTLIVENVLKVIEPLLQQIAHEAKG